MFRRMLFNIAINNTDDHLKNHEMLCVKTKTLSGEEVSEWRLAPAYDLVPNQYSYPHATSIAGLTNGSIKDDFVLFASAKMGISSEVAIEIRDQVASAVSQWEKVFKDGGCSEKDIESVRIALEQHGKKAEASYGFGVGFDDPMDPRSSLNSKIAIEAAERNKTRETINHSQSHPKEVIVPTKKTDSTSDGDTSTKRIKPSG